MTKSVRVENADTSSYKVRVTYQTKDVDGNWIDDIHAGVVELPHPTALTTVGIHSSRRAIIEEFS